ncbi:unnamed protein product [Ixodes hexagonus]
MDAPSERVRKSRAPLEKYARTPRFWSELLLKLCRNLSITPWMQPMAAQKRSHVTSEGGARCLRRPLHDGCCSRAKSEKAKPQTMDTASASAITSSGSEGKFQWTVSNQRTLIEFYGSHQFLYLPNHPDFKNKGLRETTMRILTDMLKCTVAEAKAKFHSLRTYFNREWSKTQMKTSGQGTGDNHISKCEFFEDLKFLKTSLTPQPSISSLEELLILYFQHSDTSSTPPMMTEEAIVEDTTPPEVRRPVSKRKSQPQPISEQVFEHALELLSSSAKHEDGDHAFGESVATAIAGLDEYRKDMVKMRVMQVIFEIKHSCIVEQV